MASINSLEVTASSSPRVSRYDHVNSLLIASIIVFGFLVFGLAVVWLFGGDRNFQYAPPIGDSAELIVKEEGNVDDPAFDEVVKGSNSTDLQTALESIENAISQVKASDGPNGLGIHGIPGPRNPGPPDPITPSSFVKRWKVNLEVSDIDQYKKQLDHFGIEICLVHPTEQNVWRLGSLSTAMEVTESSRDKENGAKSVYFAHKKPTLQKWDRKIAIEAGLNPEGKLIIQRYPKQLIAQIMELETEKLKELGRKLEEVSQTRIQLDRTGEHFSISISGFGFR